MIKNLNSKKDITFLGLNYFQLISIKLVNGWSIMELNSSQNGGYEIAKLWNILLGDNHLTNSNTSYFNLENYAFRMDILINNI